MIYKEYDATECPIKSVKERVIHGMGIRFGSPETKDWDGEFFVPDTELGLINGANRPFLMEHGFSKAFGVAKVADAVFEKSEIGWEYDATFLDTPLGNKAYSEIITKPYRSSAGAAGHTRRASMVKGAWQIDTWMVGEQSATLTPADPENARITRTKSDFLLMAVREMVEEIREEHETRIKAILDAVYKNSNEARQNLADALTALRTSFSTGEKFVVSEELITAIEQVSQPIQIIDFGRRK